MFINCDRISSDLLSRWLARHMFDNGILIDRGSCVLPALPHMAKVEQAV